MLLTVYIIGIVGSIFCNFYYLIITFQRASAHIITFERRRLLPRHMRLPGIHCIDGIRCHFIIAQKTAKARILHKRRAQKNV